MASFLANSSALRISRLAITASVLLGASSALASQGPGAAGGTASPLTQLVMAILVYGASARDRRRRPDRRAARALSAYQPRRQ